jgi:hypothetical protein
MVTPEGAQKENKPHPLKRTAPAYLPAVLTTELDKAQKLKTKKQHFSCSLFQNALIGMNIDPQHTKVGLIRASGSIPSSRMTISFLLSFSSFMFSLALLSFVQIFRLSPNRLSFHNSEKHKMQA